MQVTQRRLAFTIILRALTRPSAYQGKRLPLRAYTHTIKRRLGQACHVLRNAWRGKDPLLDTLRLARVGVGLRPVALGREVLNS